jgi:hypothetical protein
VWDSSANPMEPALPAVMMADRACRFERRGLSALADDAKLHSQLHAPQRRVPSS